MEHGPTAPPRPPLRLAIYRTGRTSRRHPGLLMLVMLAAWLLPSTALAEMLSVAVQEANFRAGPSKEHQVVFTAIQHYPVKVVGRNGGWVHVQDYEGDRAWVAARLLCKQKTAIVKVNRANLRKKPTIRSKVVAKVELAEVFLVKARQGLWLHLFVGDEERGWIRQDLVWGHDKS